ncbi:MAG: hypothetical protein ACXWKG_07035 [Limisphaerales bacterium]
MKSRSVIVALLLSNAVLLATATYFATRNSPLPSSTPARHVKSPAAVKKTNTQPKPFNWQQVESEDYRTFIANLRSIGCPEETIRDIVIADVNKLFAARERAVRGIDEWEYWRPNDPVPGHLGRERDAQLQVLHNQKRAVIRTLLSIDLDEELAKYNENDDALAHLEFLSPQQRSEIFAIQNRFRELKRHIYAEAERTATAPDWRQLKAAFDEREAALARVLSGDALREYQLRQDETADNLRRSLIGFEPTETEFRSLFNLLKSYDQKVAYTDPTDPAIQQRRQLDRAAVEDQIKNLLGDARYAEYRRASNPQFQELFRLTQQFDLPADTAGAIFDRHQQMQVALNQPSTLTPEQQQEQLARMQSEMDTMLRNKLGDDAYTRFQARGIEHWLGN